jgi:heme-degrading monooxygenase HmoA
VACIARVWHGITREKDAARYLEHINSKGIPAFRAVAGNCGAFVLHRASMGVSEFFVISLWESRAAIERFVGSKDIDRAVYYPEDRQYLGFPDPKVTHFDVAAGELTEAILRCLPITGS